MKEPPLSETPGAPLNEGLPGTDRLFSQFVAFLDRFCGKLEARLGVAGAAAALALLLILAAAVYVNPARDVQEMGVWYRELSVSPFDFHADNIAQFCILTPLLAHCLFIRGRLYFLFPFLVAGVLLAIIYGSSRRRGLGPAESLGLAGLVAFSTPLLFLLHYPGYPDITSYLLIFLAWLWIDTPLWPVFFALSALNHETGLFLGPWLVIEAARRKPGLRSLAWNVVLLALALAPMAIYRWYVGAHAEVLLSMPFFLRWDRILSGVRVIMYFLPLGIFEAFKLFWVFPLIALASFVERRRWLDFVSMAAILLGALGQMVFATDTSRLIGLAFPAVLLGALEARRLWGPERFTRRLWLLILLNFLVPEVYVGQNTPIPILPAPYTISIHILNWLH